MNCNHNCNQGRNCKCCYGIGYDASGQHCECQPDTSWSEVAMAGLFGLAVGGILALTYVYRTGGF